MDDTVLSNHVFKDVTYLEPRLLEGYTQLQRNDEAQAIYVEDENTTPARDWIFAKDMLSCSSLNRLALTRKKILPKNPNKIPSTFVLRPSKVESSPPQSKMEIYGYKSFPSRNTNYVTTSTRRKKLTMKPNWNTIEKPEIELKLRKEWIQENKHINLNMFNEIKSNKRNKNSNADSPKSIFPELGNDLKRVYGSPIFMQPFSKPRRPKSCNFQPIVTGVQVQFQSEPELKRLNESASGDNVPLHRNTRWRQIRKCSEKKNIKIQKKKLKIKKGNKKEKGFTDISDITDSDNARTLKAKTSAFGEKTLVEIFTPITKVFNSSSHEKLSAERYKETSENDFQSTVSETSVEAQSPFCRVHPYGVEAKLVCSECHCSLANRSIVEQHCGENSIVPSTSLGPVTSKITKPLDLKTKSNETENIQGKKHEEEKKSEPSFLSLRNTQVGRAFSMNSVYRLPSLLQQGLRKISVGTFGDADDEASSRCPRFSDEQLRYRGRTSLNMTSAADDAVRQKRRLRSIERRKQLEKQLEKQFAQEKVSSSKSLQQDFAFKRKPRRKKRSKKELHDNMDGWEYGSEGDDEREDDSSDHEVL